MKALSILSIMILTATFSVAFASNDVNTKKETQYERAVEYLDDAKITAKIKSEIFKDPLLSGFNIGVKTKDGKAYLYGKTNTVLQFNRAISTAAKQKGVRLVIADDLKVQDEVTPHADMIISALASNEIEMYNEIHPNNPIDMSNIEAEVHNKKIYVHGLAKSEDQKQLITAILKSIDGNEGVYSALRTKR